MCAPWEERWGRLLTAYLHYGLAQALGKLSQSQLRVAQLLVSGHVEDRSLGMYGKDLAKRNAGLFSCFLDSVEELILARSGKRHSMRRATTGAKAHISSA